MTSGPSDLNRKVWMTSTTADLDRGMNDFDRRKSCLNRGKSSLISREEEGQDGAGRRSRPGHRPSDLVVICSGVQPILTQ
jgi:hypothetical protein